MALFSLREIVDIILMTVFVGFIFSGYIKRSRPVHYDPLQALQQQQSFLGVDLHDLLFAALVTAPGIILHELAHKFTALSFGLSATFHAAYFWLILGVLLKLMGVPFIFFVPAYASIAGASTPLQSALIAGAGPAINAMLWGFAYGAVKYHWFQKKYDAALSLTSRVNMFLFIFNMLPFFFFDGYKFFEGLFRAFF